MLQQWLKANKISLARAAREIGMSEAHLGNVVKRRSRCAIEVAAIISKYTKGEVSVDDILIPKEPRIKCPTCGHLAKASCYEAQKTWLEKAGIA